MELKHFGELTPTEKQKDQQIFMLVDHIADILHHEFKDLNCTVCPNCKNRTFDYPYKEGEGVKRGCCRHCAREVGYFWAFGTKKAKIIYQRFWYDDVYGFFNPETMSCNIPRARRSTTCLRYTCEQMTKKVKDKSWADKVGKLAQANRELKSYLNIPF